jgi:hypothetical protein
MPNNRYQVMSGAYDVWHGGKLETVKAFVRVDGATGETWILQERLEGGRALREWVRVPEAR